MARIHTMGIPIGQFAIDKRRDRQQLTRQIEHTCVDLARLPPSESCRDPLARRVGDFS